MSEKTKSNFDEWCLVELFGHQRIVGKVSESVLAGGAFLRVDVPAFDGKPAFTRMYGPGAIYSISPITEQIARDLMAHYRNEPVSRFDLPQIAEKAQEDETAQVQSDEAQQAAADEWDAKNAAKEDETPF